MEQINEAQLLRAYIYDIKNKLERCEAEVKEAPDDIEAFISYDKTLGDCLEIVKDFGNEKLLLTQDINSSSNS